METEPGTWSPCFRIRLETLFCQNWMLCKCKSMKSLTLKSLLSQCIMPNKFSSHRWNHMILNYNMTLLNSCTCFSLMHKYIRLIDSSHCSIFCTSKLYENVWLIHLHRRWLHRCSALIVTTCMLYKTESIAPKTHHLSCQVGISQMHTQWNYLKSLWKSILLITSNRRNDTAFVR